jgi:hypothetical protein
MKTTPPLLIFFTGIITALFFYQFFGNSLLYFNDNNHIEKNEVISQINFRSSSAIIETVTLDISALKSQIEILKSKFDALPNIGSQHSYIDEFAKLKKEISDFKNIVNNEMNTYSSNQLALSNALKEKQIDNTSNNLPTSKFDMITAMQKADEKRQQEIENINQSFQAESLNQQWASEVKQNITNYFDSSKNENQNETTQSTALSIECRSTMCRMEVMHENEEVKEKFDLEFLSSLGDSFPSITYGQQGENSDGSFSAVLFLERETETSQDDFKLF